jgi:hypothetical protein
VSKRGESPSFFFFPLPLWGRGIKGDRVLKLRGVRLIRSLDFYR